MSHNGLPPVSDHYLRPGFRKPLGLKVVKDTQWGILSWSHSRYGQLPQHTSNFTGHRFYCGPEAVTATIIVIIKKYVNIQLYHDMKYSYIQLLSDQKN
jgi:hypothetical protein